MEDGDEVTVGRNPLLNEPALIVIVNSVVLNELIHLKKETLSAVKGGGSISKDGCFNMWLGDCGITER